MKLPREKHVRFQRLISARLDAPLEACDEYDLLQHMSACSACRSLARDYRAQRAGLQGLRAASPPRDLWARTSAALDREMARSPRASRRRAARNRNALGTRSAPSSRWLAVTATTSVLLAGAVIATQLRGNLLPSPVTGTQALLATPFGVVPQNMAVFNFTAQGVSVYQTRVAEACPPPVIDCTSVQLPTLPVIRIGSGSTASHSVSVNARGGRLALVAGNADGADTVSVVSLPPYTAAPGATQASAATPPADDSGAPPATDSPSPATTDGAGAASHTPDASATRTPRASSTPDQTPRPSRTPRPDKSAAASADPSNSPPASASPSSGAASDEPSPPPSTTGSGSGAGGSDSTAPPVQAALDIAVGVHLVGAAPAWSGDGEMLAFSATPADDSTGPDTYLWHVGDAKAARLTQDHRSYFASWAGDRIVISRLPADHVGLDAASPAQGSVDAATIVRDVASGDERVARGPHLWLPSVEPASRYAVAWVGRLKVAGNGVTPRLGGLYFVDWSAIDPFASSSVTPGSSPVGGDNTGTELTPSPSTSPAGPAATEPTASNPPRRQHASPIPDPKASSKSSPGASTTPPPTEPGDSTAPQVLRSVDPQRDETVDPVLDWVVRWAPDGAAVGIWVADAPGGNWGRLSVRRVAADRSTVSPDAILGPSLARRGFSLGTDRVAWVAPSPDAADGELRIRTWDAHGYGDLRIRSVDVGDGVPSF